MEGVGAARYRDSQLGTCVPDHITREPRTGAVIFTFYTKNPLSRDLAQGSGSVDFVYRKCASTYAANICEICDHTPPSGLLASHGSNLQAYLKFCLFGLWSLLKADACGHLYTQAS